jgi:hypothetical protein
MPTRCPDNQLFEVPAQVVPGPAAQSFRPLRATPKHFSLDEPSADARSGSAAIALAKAPARANEVSVILVVDMAKFPSVQ